MSRTEEMYWRTRSDMIAKELAWLQAREGTLGDPWMRLRRAVRNVDADFRRVLTDLKKQLECSRG